MAFGRLLLAALLFASSAALVVPAPQRRHTIPVSVNTPAAHHRPELLEKADDVRRQMAEARARRRGLRQQLARAEALPKTLQTKFTRELEEKKKQLETLEEQKILLWRQANAAALRSTRSASRMLRDFNERPPPL